ncbi:glucan -beta-glucosidase protein [Apiospora arundinis]
MPPTITADKPPSPTATTTEKDIGPLPEYTKWPAAAVITPVAIEVDKPKKSDDDDKSSVIPCKLWFFFFPPPLNIKGNLPPWPRFTVGNDHIPTFPSQPEPTKCETQTASVCSTTTSFVVSTTDGAPRTVSTQVGSSTCAEVKGCMVTGSDHEATTQRTAACQMATVTDMTISCSGTGTSDCFTQTAAPKTGCSESVSASTTTISCRAASPTNPAKRQAGDQGAGDACAEVREWLVWPKEGRDKAQTDAIFARIKDAVEDEHRIHVSDTKTAGINFWSVMLEAGQEKQIKEIENVVSVHPQCSSECPDPTAESHWRYQSDYRWETPLINDGIAQMAFLSQSKSQLVLERQGEAARFFFDESAGEDIPVYIVDSGANLRHPEFEKIRHKAEFIHVDPDLDNHEDDSGLNVDQVCLHDNKNLCITHGTSMLGFVAGAHLGVAKNVKPYLVRVPRRHPWGGGAKPSDWLKGVAAVLDRYPQKSRTTVAVLGLSWYWTEEGYAQDLDPKEQAFRGYRLRLATLIEMLIERGVLVVTGSGNFPTGGTILKLSGWPALYGVPKETIQPKWELAKYKDSWQYIPDLLVVGALSPDTGGKWGQSGILPDASFPELYAPGDWLVGITGDEKRWPQPELLGKGGSHYKESSGTSDAAAYTAGLAAYFLKLHQLGRLPNDATGQAPDPDMSPRGLKQYIMNMAWARNPGTGRVEGPVRGIWNGATRERILVEGGACPWNPRAPEKLRRRAVQGRSMNRDQEPLTGQCLLPQSEMPNTGTTATATAGKPTGTRDSAAGNSVSSTSQSGSASPSNPSETAFVCTEDRCAPLLNCHAPNRPGCRDGKCACIGDADDPSQAWKCTEETKKECSPCQAPQEVACSNEKKCTCTQPPTTMITSTQPPPPPLPKPTTPPLTKQDTGPLECNAAFDHHDVSAKDMDGFAKSVCEDKRFDKLDRFSPKSIYAWTATDTFGDKGAGPCYNNKGSGGRQRLGCLEYFFSPMEVPKDEIPLLQGQ